MLDSVATARKVEEFRALAEKWAQENPIDIDGQQFFANIESCLDFSTALKPVVEVYEKTPYRKEWGIIQKQMHTGFRKSVLFEFKGKENEAVPVKDLDRIDNPFDLMHLLNIDLTRIIRSSRLDFNWRIDYDNDQKTLTLTTCPIR